MDGGELPDSLQAGMSATQKYKVVLLGDQSVGKTSLIVRYLKNTFDEKVDATIGMDFQSKTVHLPDRSVRLQLWDTAGQERFRSLVNSYIRDAAAAVIVYDITKRLSFANTAKWVEEVRSARGDEAVIMIVGNKSDATEQRQVSPEEGKRQAQEVGAEFTETSAKTGENVSNLFQQLAAVLQVEASIQRAAVGGSAEAGAGSAGQAGVHLQAANVNGSGEGAAGSKKPCQC